MLCIEYDTLLWFINSILQSVVFIASAALALLFFAPRWPRTDPGEWRWMINNRNNFNGVSFFVLTDVLWQLSTAPDTTRGEWRNSCRRPTTNSRRPGAKWARFKVVWRWQLLGLRSSRPRWVWKTSRRHRRRWQRSCRWTSWCGIKAKQTTTGCCKMVICRSRSMLPRMIKNKKPNRCSCWCLWRRAS